MDFFAELLLSAVLAILLAFLLSSGGRAATSSRPLATGEAVAASSAVDSPEVEAMGAASRSREKSEFPESDEVKSGEIVNPKSSPNTSHGDGDGDGDVVEIERVVGEEEEEEDGWEKFERSETEEKFREAAVFMASEAGKAAAARLGGEAQMRLYGLHKVATEGPCREPQPMALKFSARARWNAWQKLGNMHPEVSMEQYVALVSECVPGWAEGKLREEAKVIGSDDTLGAAFFETNLPDLSSTSHPQEKPAVERLTEDSCRDGANAEGADDKLSKQGLTKTLLFNILSPTRATFLTLNR